MTEVTYEVVAHDGGWAYRVERTYSETFVSRRDAVDAAHAAAVRQRRPGADAVIRYEDDQGRWRSERSRGSDRPETRAED